MLSSIFEIILAIFLVMAFLIFLLASLYDIKTRMSPKVFKKISSGLRGNRRPFVTVLIYVQNNSTLIVNCLESVRKNRYSKSDVVVVDNSASIKTQRTIRQYQKNHPLFMFRHYRKRQLCDQQIALRHGYAKSKKGDMVLVLDAKAEIGQTFIKNSVVGLLANPSVDAIQLQAGRSDIDSLVVMMRKYIDLSKSTIKKAMSIFSDKYSKSNNIVNIIYRQNAFLKIYKQKSAPQKNIFKFVLVLVAVSLQTYSMYVAATTHDNLLLTIGFIAIFVWLAVLVLSDLTLGFREKSELMFGAVSGYILIYVYLLNYLLFVVARVALPVFVSKRKVLF